MARTAKQRAALRKAQLASARKRKGKGNSKLKAAHSKARRRMGTAARIGVGAVAAGAGIYAYGKYKKRNNYKAPKKSSRATSTRRSSSIPRSTKPSDFDKRYARAVAYRQSQVKDAKSKRKNAKYARQSKKVSDRGLYNAGLSSNVGGRTFVAGRGGTYRR